MIYAIAIMGTVSVAAMATFTLFVIGIRKGDRGHLSNPPRSASDAISRHCLIGIRANSREAGK
jgi:hypothetical protein